MRERERERERKRERERERESVCVCVLGGACGWAPHKMARPGPRVIKRELVNKRLFY